MTTSNLFSVLFLVVCTLSGLLGANALMTRRRESIHWLFLAISICLGVWSLGFAIATSAPTAQACLFWRRFAAVGWSSLFAIILHFTLALTGRTKNLRCKWLPALLYLPALACLYVFSISDHFTLVQYRLVRTAYGWYNAAVNNGWDIFFYAFYGLYYIATMVLLIFWMKSSPDKQAKSQGRILLLSFGAAVLLGTITDMINNSFYLFDIPQMAPLAFLIPLYAINRSMRKYGLLNISGSNEDENILTDTARRRVLHFLVYGFLAAGPLYFITMFWMNQFSLQETVFPSAFLTLVGVFLSVVLWKNVRRAAIDRIFIAAAAVTIPALTINFIQFGSITVWAIPFAFVLLSVLFNSVTLLVGSAISTLVTQLAVWCIAGNVSVRVDGSDYLVRICLFAISICIAFYINRVYVHRLKENVEKNKYQTLISDASALFLTVSEQNEEERIGLLLEKTAACMGACGASLTLFGTEGGEPRLFARRAAGAPRETPAPGEAPSYAALPVDSSGQAVGRLNLHTGDPRHGMKAGQAETMKVVANILSEALTKLSAEQEIEFLAYHDSLTRLPNRLLFSEMAAQAIAEARSEGRLTGVVFLDLDSFKSVNDSMGHRAGDELIKEVARELTGLVGFSGVVSRFSGDEYLVLLNGAACAADLTSEVDAIMARFKEPFKTQGREAYLTASAGIAVCPDDGIDADTLIKNADTALYNAKEKGKNQYLFCSREMKEEARRKVTLTNLLYQALDRNELQIQYQPQISLQTNQIVGAEALLRWSCPGIGAIPPGVFIPLAEKSGLINSIGDWVLSQACRQNRQWQDKGLPAIRVGVNISVNQLRSPLFVDRVRSILLESALDPGYLDLEITESVAITEPGYFVPLLNQLKALGVSLSIDDFGTEYSSLSRLKQLPADRIKIDMQFVQGIDKNEKDKAISKVIINLAGSLGLKVIAEGVENNEQLMFLGRELCDEVQGFLYHKPLPAEEFESVLRSQLS